MPDPLEKLTAREREIVRLVGEGLTTRQIALHLVISERTVELHMDFIRRKLAPGPDTDAAEA